MQILPDSKIQKSLQVWINRKVNFLTFYTYILVLLRQIRILKWRFLENKKNSKIYVRNWYGRLGNNLAQIATVEWIAQATQVKISLPEHPLLELGKFYDLHSQDDFWVNKLKYLNAERSAMQSKYQPIKQLARIAYQVETDLFFQNADSLNGLFFYNYDFIGQRQPSFLDYRSIFKSQFYHLFPIQHDSRVNSETLVIHLRSGDIFEPKNEWSRTVQPPLAFYEKIIESFQFKDIILVSTPNQANPCIQALQEKYPNAKFLSNSLAEDIGTLLSASNLVMSNSSFPLTLALCSQNIKKLFVPSFSKYEPISLKLSSIQLNLFKICNHNIPLNGVNLQASELDFQLFRLHLPNYIPIGNWQANKFQLNRMRSYPINLIEVESNR